MNIADMFNVEGYPVVEVSWTSRRQPFIGVIRDLYALDTGVSSLPDDFNVTDGKEGRDRFTVCCFLVFQANVMFMENVQSGLNPLLSKAMEDLRKAIMDLKDQNVVNLPVYRQMEGCALKWEQDLPLYSGKEANPGTKYFPKVVSLRKSNKEIIFSSADSEQFQSALGGGFLEDICSFAP